MLDADLNWLLAYQHRVISREQALKLGMTEQVLRRKLRVGGPWQRILPGVYLAVTGAPTRDQLDAAALLHAGRPGLLSGAAALRRYDVKCPGTPFTDVLIPAAGKRLSCGHVRIQRTTRMPTSFSVHGCIRFTLPPRAVIDAALRLTSLRDIRAVMAGAVQQGTCSLRQLETELGNSRLRNSAPLRVVLSEVADGARSSPEADLMHLIKSSGLPTPLYNPRLYVGADFLASPDAWWKEQSVAAEVDSREWHLGPQGWEGTMSRHDRMAAAGIRVLHFTPRKIRAEPAEVISLIRSALLTGSPLPGIRTVPVATR
ncbi:MAG: hypothetical protein ACLQFR_32260 [Streptosporangiaceae bacterium]